MAEDRTGRGNPPVAGQHKIETSAHAIPVDRGIHGGGEAGNGVHQRPAHLREFNRAGCGQSSDFVEVGASREELFIAGEDQWARVASKIFYCVRQGEHAGAGQAIGVIG